MSRRKGKKGYLPDGGFLFRMYYEMGEGKSHIKVREWCYRNGYRNPATGEMPTDAACWNKMWRWALHKENQEEAYQIFNRAMRDEGKFYSEEDWKEYLDNMALSVLNMNVRTYKSYQNGKY